MGADQRQLPDHRRSDRHDVDEDAQGVVNAYPPGELSTTLMLSNNQIPPAQGGL